MIEKKFAKFAFLGFENFPDILEIAGKYLQAYFFQSERKRQFLTLLPPSPGKGGGGRRLSQSGSEKVVGIFSKSKDGEELATYDID